MSNIKHARVIFLLEGPIVHTTLSEEVYKRIRLSLFNNLYKPGDQLDIGQIANDFQVSRQPVKEAIKCLAQEGLVEIRQRVGTFVRTFNRTDVRNVLDIRRMIEIFALQNGTVDSASLLVLEREIERMDRFSDKNSFDYLGYNDADHTFHKTLVGLSRNDFLMTMYAQLNAHYVTARAFYANPVERIFTKHGQHLEILQQLRKGDLDCAVSVLDEHIRRAQSELLKAFNDGYSQFRVGKASL
jgi:DNA-binding GntR family transcriptional regulator